MPAIHICNLPDDVLRGIFQHSCYCQFPDLDKWKSLLRLLSICQRWRHLAIPLVYNHVYLSHYDQLDESEIVKNVPVSSIKTARTKTNLDLFVNNSCTHTARYADIKISFESNLFDGLRQAIEYMKTAQKAWRGIKTLTLTLAGEVQPVEGQASDESNHATHIKRFTKKIHKLMPGLLKLRFKGRLLEHTSKYLCGNLTGHYQSQLKTLSSRQAIVLSKKFNFPQITKLDIRLDSSNGYMLSRICTASLVHLNLRGVPINYQWTAFRDGNGTECVVFPYLKTLNLSYTSNAMMMDRSNTEMQHGGRHPNIALPALQKLHIWSTLGHCEILAFAVLPKKMDILDVLGSSETMRLLSNMRIPLVKKLSLNVATATSSINHGTLESINKILKNSPECRINRLIVNEYTIIIDPTVIEWSRLTLLHIGAPTNMDNALKIIAKLPNLVELMFYNFVPEAIPEEALALDKGSEFHSKLAPLNSTITKLMLGYDALDYSEDSVLAVIKYLSVRLELLSLFGAQVAFDTDMTEFVNGYSDIYPNLTNVTFRLGVTEIL